MYISISTFFLLSPAVLFPVEGRRLREWLAAAGWAHRASGLGPQQGSGWLLREEQKQQAAGLVPCRPGGQYLEAPSSLTPSTLWHPPCGTHAAFRVWVVKLVP